MERHTVGIEGQRPARDRQGRGAAFDFKFPCETRFARSQFDILSFERAAECSARAVEQEAPDFSVLADAPDQDVFRLFPLLSPFSLRSSSVDNTIIVPL